MGRRQILVAGWLALGANQQAICDEPVSGPLPAPPAAILGKIDGEEVKGSSFINIRFDRKPTAETLALEEHGSFVELKLANTVVADPGKFIDSGVKYLTKIATYQTEPTNAVVRMFVSENASKIKDAMRADVLGERIVITLDHSKLAVAGPGGPSAEEMISKTAVSADIPAPAVLLQSTIADAKSTKTDDYRQILVYATILSAVIIGLILLRATVSRRIRRGQGKEPVFQMRTLASLPLTPKQKLSLVQIGSEKLILAISPEQVTLLGTIGARAEPQRLVEKRVPALEAPKAAPQPPLAARAQKKVSPAQVAAPRPLPAGEPIEELSLSQKMGKSVLARETEIPANVGSRFNFAIGDDGIVDKLEMRAEHELTRSGPQRAIEDITQLIRSKLKGLPET